MIPYILGYSPPPDYGYYGCRIWRKASHGLAHKHAIVSCKLISCQRWCSTGHFSGLPPSPLQELLSFIFFLLTPWTVKEKEGLARTQWFRHKGSSYFTAQCTQPQTIGYSLADSSVGLLVWIYEKLHNWTDSYQWKDDEGEQVVPDHAERYWFCAVLTWISIYWFSRAGPAASVRIYFEVMQGQQDTPLLLPYPKIPMGISLFPNNIYVFPKAYVSLSCLEWPRLTLCNWTRRGQRVVAEFEHESGGHFASHETPQVLADDLRRMFGKGGRAYGVVPGKDGYSWSIPWMLYSINLNPLHFVVSSVMWLSRMWQPATGMICYSFSVWLCMNSSLMMSYLADSIKLIITLLPLYKIPVSSSPTSTTMPLESRVDVLIIGAGLAGLMCANALIRSRNGRRRCEDHW